MKKLGIFSIALALAFGLAGTASAQSRTIHDGIDHGIPRYSDIRGLSVHNRAKIVTATIRLSRVVPDKTSAYLLIQAKKGKKATPLLYSVGTEASGHGHRWVLIGFSDEDSSKSVKCPGLHVRVVPRQQRVRIRVPQHCLTGLPWMRASSFGALTEEPGNGSDEDQTRMFPLHRG
ncbi:MAG TPA: hypothetical protein VF426_09900 [Marmoricola sp.]